MAKIEKFENEFLDLGLYQSAMIVIAFEKEFGQSLADLSTSGKIGVEHLAFIVFTAHKSYCKIKGKDCGLGFEDILDKMTLEELTEAFQLIYPSEEKPDQSKAKESQKKT